MRALVVFAIVAAQAACTTTTTFRDAGGAPDRELVVDDHDYGPIPDGGVDVPVGIGYAPLHWQVREAGKVIAEGDVERDQVVWGIVIGAGLAAACCIPTMAATGFCLANPLAYAGCFTGNVGGIVTACQAPGWSSIPMTAVGSAVGASPLMFGLLGAHPASEVVLTTPSPAARPQPQPPVPTSSTPKSEPAVSAAPTGAMWF